MKNSSETKSFRRRRALLALMLGAISLVGFMLFLNIWGQGDRAQKADAIVVLGAYVQPGGQASEALRNRVLRGAELYKQGLAAHVITTGGVGDNPPAEALVAAQILRENGVPAHAIFTETTSTSTWENALNAKKICREHNWKRVIVISEPFHLWRATHNFERQGLRAFSSPSPDSRLRFHIWMTLREMPLVLRDLLLRRV